jgi:hypothetical protein
MLRALLLSATALALSGPPAAADGLPAVDGAWARPTAVKVGVVYMRMTGGAADVRLTAAETPVAARVEIHESRMDGGMMEMRAVGQVDIPAGRVVEFRTGGLHLMLIGLERPLAEGMRFPVVLRFGTAGARTVEVEVRRRAPR